MTSNLESSIQLNFAYQRKLSCITELIDGVKNQENYDLQTIFDICWPHICDIVPFLTCGVVLGLKSDSIKYYAEQNHAARLLRNPEKIDDNSKNKMVATLLRTDEKDYSLWNYEKDSPSFLKGPAEHSAIFLSRLCEHPDDEFMFLLLFRIEPSKPFLSDDVQMIKIVSRIIGMHINYLYTYQNILYDIYGDYKRKFERYLKVKQEEKDFDRQ